MSPFSHLAVDRSGIVILAQAGIQNPPPKTMDSRLRGNDGSGQALDSPFSTTRLS